MQYLVVFSILSLLLVQGLCLEEPSESEVSGFKDLVSEWSAKARRIIRSLENQPAEDAGKVSAQLQDALSEARQKRETPQESSGGDGIQNFLSNLNEGFKSVMNNVTSSSLFQQVQKVGESWSEKGKEFVEKIGEQVKNFQQEKKPSS